MLDRILAREIKQLTGDGSREAKFALLKKVDAAAEDLADPHAIASTTALRPMAGRWWPSVLLRHSTSGATDWTIGSSDGRRKFWIFFPDGQRGTGSGPT